MYMYMYIYLIFIPEEMRPLNELTLEKKKPVRLMKLHDYPVTAITTINQ